ncbi:MAG: hypothetical protein ACLRFE_00965 [Clostridia bacterium]
MSLIKKILNAFVKPEIKQEVINNPKQYTSEELDNLTYAINDVYRVTLRRKVKTKNMVEPRKEVKTILAIRAGDDLYMDIETGQYYNASRYISDLNTINVWTAYEMQYRFYVMETLLDKHIDYDEKFTAKQLRELIRIQRQRYKTPMYESDKWGVNR